MHIRLDKQDRDEKSKTLNDRKPLAEIVMEGQFKKA
jgi:hypothetical protein